jgi:hypothetical protein
MCVVRVDDGPDGVRWAQVSVQFDELTDWSSVTRARTTSGASVLTRVADFLRSAGLDVAADVPAAPD